MDDQDHESTGGKGTLIDYKVSEVETGVPSVSNVASINNVASVNNDVVHIDAQTAEAMRQHFDLWATLGINYSITGTPIAIGTFLAFVIGVGGSPVYIFGYIVAAVLQLVVCTSLAELAAAFPHSTGASICCSGRVVTCY